MLNRYYSRREQPIWDIPYDGSCLTRYAPEVYLINEAGNVTTGTHRYKFTWVGASSGQTKPGEPSATVTTDAASAGKVAIILPYYLGSAGPVVSDGSGINIYRTEAGGTTYKLLTAAPLTWTSGDSLLYLDNIADGSLGAAAPSSNNAVPTLTDPPLVATRVAALTAGSGTDMLVAQYLMNYQWTLQNGASNNVALFVPGSYDNTGTGYDERYQWTAHDTPSAAVTIPSYSSDWDAMQALIVHCAYELFLETTIVLHDQNVPYGETARVTVTPAGGTAISDTVAYDTTGATYDDYTAAVPLLVCKLLLQAIHDQDWY